MIVNKVQDSGGYKDFRAWLPFTTRTRDTDGNQWLNIWPRPNVMLEHNYTKTEDGQTATIPDWYIFPNWRRGAHSFNYIPITYQQDTNPTTSGGSIIRDRKISIGTWSSSNRRPNISGRNWIQSVMYNDLGTNPSSASGCVHCTYKFIPMAPGYLDSNNKCSLVGGFLDTPWTNQTYTKFNHLHNNYWFKYGDYNSSSKVIAESQFLINPTAYAHNASYIDRDDMAFRMDRACIYNSYDYNTKVPVGSCEYFYCPEFYIVWSTDQSVNPACFTAGIEGYRTNDSTAYWNSSRPSDHTPFMLEIGFKDSSCTTGSQVKFQSYTQARGGTFINRTLGNDNYGSKIINLGKWGDKYFYAAYITALGAASRSGTVNPHLLGGRDSNFNRVTYKYWYYSLPYVCAEFSSPGDQEGMYRPIICPLGTTIRIHSFGVNFWGGEPIDLDRTWGGGANHYRGWLTKKFNSSTILWP